MKLRWGRGLRGIAFFALLLGAARSGAQVQAEEKGPGGPAAMVPGQHHVRMNMYIAQVKGGAFKVVKSLGMIDPKECVQGVK